MNWLDILIFAVGGVIALLGWRMGGLRIAATAVGIMVGLTLASRLHDDVRPMFSAFKISDNAAEIGAFIAIFALVLAASVAISFPIRALPKKFMIGWVDNTLGLGLGIAFIRTTIRAQKL